jgi:hypothetical protein
MARTWASEGEIERIIRMTSVTVNHDPITTQGWVEGRSEK